MKYFQLRDGTVVPAMAFGTGSALFGADASASVCRALQCDFRHVDTAQVYKNEESVGNGIAEFMGRTKTPRRTIFVTAKLGPLQDGQTVLASLQESLRKLKLDYVDLFLIHNPKSHDKYQRNVATVWSGMVEAKRLGLTRSIGVSNFNVKYLEQIRATGLEMPVVNQVRVASIHPLEPKH